jgi:hypothetical protein
MDQGPNDNDSLRKNAEQRYCAAVESHDDSKRMPETPSKIAYERLYGRVKSYRSHVSTIDTTYDQAMKAGPARGQTVADHKAFLTTIGPPMDGDLWLSDSPEIDVATREELETEILIAPDGHQYASFYIAHVLNSQKVGTRHFGIFETKAEKSVHPREQFYDKASEDGQSSYWVSLYTGERFRDGEAEIWKAGLWPNYQKLMLRLGIDLDDRGDFSASAPKAVA